MSRSYLKDSYQKKLVKERLERYNENPNTEVCNNPHKWDESPKNKASKRIKINCPNHDWLQEPINYGGHKVKGEGHRMVNGIVRAKEKEKIRKELEEYEN